jgi:hypothetical protein
MMIMVFILSALQAFLIVVMIVRIRKLNELARNLSSLTATTDQLLTRVQAKLQKWGDDL